MFAIRNLAIINTINITLENYEMIHFKDLDNKWRQCPNFDTTGNTVATINISSFDLDIVRKPATRSYKVKPFDYIKEKKAYIPNLFEEYGEYPEFRDRESLVVFLNEVDKINTSDVSGEIVDDMTEEEL